MSFLVGALLLAALAFGGAYVGDPTFRPDQDPGSWSVTIIAIEETN